MSENLKILIVTPEIYPFESNTGFAKILNTFVTKFKERGCDVRVVMPKYKHTLDNYEYKTIADFPVQIDWNKPTAIVRESKITSDKGLDIPVYFIDNYQYFDRDNPYNYFDEAERFAFFCRTVLYMLPEIGFQPDIIHCNDWESAPIAVLFKERYSKNPFYKNMKVVYTVHNMKYQGNYPKEVLKLFNLDDTYFTSEKLEFYGQVSFMKAGLMYSDLITTFSQIYATKLQTSDFGERMEGVLQYRRNDLFGIINGIDYARYNPANDKALYANYSVDTLELKKKNKDHLQTELGLPNKDVPVICIISNLMEEKGFNLLDKIWEDILSQDIQVIVLGKGDVYYENKLIRLKGKYTDKIGLWIGENEDLEQRVIAGSDIFLLPSKFDFFPYKQMVSMRYGTVPIVRANGDVEDTVINYDFTRNRGTGFVFPDYSHNQLLDIINRVIMLYRDRKDIWKKIMEQGMKEDFSFDRTITEYIEIYKRAMTKN